MKAAVALQPCDFIIISIAYGAPLFNSFIMFDSWLPLQPLFFAFFGFHLTQTKKPAPKADAGSDFSIKRVE
ncbi:MAG: hypothetical protein ACI4J3_03020 [Oscillospiraceae bacterium]